MHGILLTIHIILSVLLILVVLVQSGRSGGISGLFGGGGADALFSTSSQQSGLRNATIVIAGLFFLTSLGLTMISSRERIQTVFNRNVPTPPPLNLPAQTTTEGSKGGAAGQPDVAKPAVPAPNTDKK